jgi:hypothetical protein
MLQEHNLLSATEVVETKVGGLMWNCMLLFRLIPFASLAWTYTCIIEERAISWDNSRHHTLSDATTPGDGTTRPTCLGNLLKRQRFWGAWAIYPAWELAQADRPEVRGNHQGSVTQPHCNIVVCVYDICLSNASCRHVKSRVDRSLCRRQSVTAHNLWEKCGEKSWLRRSGDPALGVQKF